MYMSLTVTVAVAVAVAVMDETAAGQGRESEVCDGRVRSSGSGCTAAVCAVAPIGAELGRRWRGEAVCDGEMRKVQDMFCCLGVYRSLCFELRRAGGKGDDIGNIRGDEAVRAERSTHHEHSFPLALFLLVPRATLSSMFAILVPSFPARLTASCTGTAEQDPSLPPHMRVDERHHLLVDQRGAADEHAHGKEGEDVGEEFGREGEEVAGIARRVGWRGRV